LRSLLKKIFGTTGKEKTLEKDTFKSKIELDKKIPEKLMDEMFAENFTINGGKFIYCPEEKDLLQSLSMILKENSWDEVCTFNMNLKEFLTRISVSSNETPNESKVFFSDCEAIIADDGSILISSNQTKGRKLVDLPYDFIIIAQISDLVKDRSAGLSHINMKYKKNMPSNLTTIKGPKTVTGTDNILDTGSINTSKHIYLLLLE
jgi:L-lactate utilization protein LutC